MSDEPTLPVVDPAELDSAATIDGPIGGVLLAAGTSSRYEAGNKLLSGLEGEPVVRHAGRHLASAALDSRVAVLGRDADAVREALEDLGFEFVVNPAYADGQATSVRAGLEALPTVAGAVFALGDMPCIDPGSIEALVSAYRTGRWSALAAAVDGQRGNPVLFDARHFDALAALDGDTGGRDVLLSAEDAALVETGDPGVVQDVDTVGDLEYLRRT